MRDSDETLPLLDSADGVASPEQNARHFRNFFEISHSRVDSTERASKIDIPESPES
jgi:hypothetical protein